MELRTGEPLFRSNINIAYTHTIAGTVYEKIAPWLYKNHIQVRCVYESIIKETNNNTDIIASDIFGGVPFFEYDRINRDTYLKISKDALLDIIRLVIKNGYYICLYVDEFYIPGKWAYQKEHFDHLLMIFGVDEISDTFSILGYDGSRKYTPEKIKSADLIEAINASNDRDIRLLRLRDDIHTEDDVPLIRETLADYLNSTDCSEKLWKYYDGAEEKKPFRSLDTYYRHYSRSRYVFGLNTYNCLLEYLDRHKDNAKNGEWRPLFQNSFHALIEHKDCMLKRFQYLHDKGYCGDVSGIAEIYRNTVGLPCVEMQNLVLKYDMTKNEEIYGRIADIVVRVKNSEEALLTTFTKML